MSEFSVSQEVVDEAAASCARLLVKWFGGVEEAIQELQKDPVAMAQIAIAQHRDDVRHMSLRAHMRITDFSRLVCQEMKFNAVGQ